MESSRRIACLAAIVAIVAAATASASVDPCFKNHYILDEPCTLEWTAVNSGLGDRDVRVVAVDPVVPTTLYAGGPSGIFKSLDGGAAWMKTGLELKIETAASYPLPHGPPQSFVARSIVAHLAIDSLNPDTLYAGTIKSKGCMFFQRRLFKSTDGGASWTDGISPAINGCDNIHSMVLAPGDPSTLYVTNFDGMGDSPSPLIKSTDRAATWTAPVFQVLNVLAVDPLDSRTVYAGTFGFEPYFTSLPNGVLKSRDGGATWSATGLTGAGVSALTIDPANPRTLYAATVSGSGNTQLFEGVFKSTDGGTEWTALNDGLGHFIGTSASVTALVVDPDDSDCVYLAISYYLATGGISRSTDGGATWSAFNEGLATPYVRSLAFAPGSPNTLYAATAAGVFKRGVPCATR